LRGRAEIRFAENFGELRELLRHLTGEIGAVIVCPSDRAGMPAATILREIARARPDVPLVAYCRAGVEHSADIRGLAAAGVHEYLFAGIDDSGIALRAVLDSARRECATDAVLQRLGPLLPKRLQTFAEYCLAQPATTKSVAGVASMLGVNRKTLVNHCAQEGCPPPAELIAWCRLVLVAYLLERTDRTVESIALELDFPSDTALRNMMKRYTGLRAIEVRQRGGVACVLDALSRRLRVLRHAQGAADLVVPRVTPRESLPVA
jgi:AraC-like DNA-binding protein